jgi:hypothetical protein
VTSPALCSQVSSLVISYCVLGNVHGQQRNRIIPEGIFYPGVVILLLYPGVVVLLFFRCGRIVILSKCGSIVIFPSLVVLLFFQVW